MAPDAFEDTTAIGATQAVVTIESRESQVRHEESRRVFGPVLFFLCIICILEGADQTLLPAMLYALERDLSLSLSNLALMSMCQAVATSLFAPLWGIIADRGTIPRRRLLVLGCICQGLVTVMLSRVSSMGSMLPLRILNGMMLASLSPLSKGILVEVVPEASRGQAFGYIALSLAVGGMAGAVIGTQMGTHFFYEVAGWRLAFLLVGSAAVIVGSITFFMVTPTARELAVKHNRSITADLRRLSGYFQINTFNMIVLQGCFGAIPWTAMSYNSLFFRLSGVSEHHISILLVVGGISTAVGNLCGGFIGDAMANWSPNHGRAFTAQITVLAGIPFVAVLFMFPVSPENMFPFYFAVTMGLGLTSTWCASGVNAPILCDLVDADSRTTVLAWEQALEGSFANACGNILIGFLGQSVFGYDFANPNGNLAALSKALIFVATIPWVFCFCVYSMLHRFYPEDMRDRRAVRKLKVDSASYTNLSSKVP